MRVLQLGKYFPPYVGGIETIIFNLTEELNKRGIKTDVLCSNFKKYYKKETDRGYIVYKTKRYGELLSTPITPQLIFKLKKIISDYDIIHVHHPNPIANLALFFAKPKEQKIVLHWHSDIIKQKLTLKLYLPLLKWLVKKANIILATNPQIIKHSSILKLNQEKCIIIPLGTVKPKINNHIFSSLKKFHKNKKIIFSLGRFVYYKGFEYLIESAKYLTNDIIILIGGSGPLKAKYEKLIRKYNFKDKVHLIGKIPSQNLGSYYKACDLFCLPSIEKSEAFGLVMVEAMSFGKPVVATKIEGSGVSWVNQHQITGLNVPPKNPKALAEAFTYILENENVYQQFSRNALKRYETEFTLEKMIDRVINVYQRLS